MQQCITCGGDGYLVGSIAVDCAACGTMGAIYDQPCFCCDGTGVIETIGPDVLCLACDGTGETGKTI